MKSSLPPRHRTAATLSTGAHPTTARRPGLVRALLIAAVLVALAHLLDEWTYHNFAVEDVYGSDFGRMLRVMGFVPLWMLAAAALVLHDWPLRARLGAAAAWRRGGLLLGSAVASGIVGELLKLVFRRERPRAHDGEYVFRAFTERPFSSGGLGLPSTHAIVAFGAAAMLHHLFPRARPVWWALAIGCGLSRMADGAHFLSDVVAAALVATAIATLLWQRFGAGRTNAE